MNRTKKLMATVTTSLLMTGAVPSPVFLSPAFGQAAPQPEEAWKTDPQVKKAAEQIMEWLDDVADKDAKTREEIQKQFPAFSGALLDNALKRLELYEKGIKKLGDGTKDHPYRYYGRDVSVHG